MSIWVVCVFVCVQGEGLTSSNLLFMQPREQIGK